MSLAILHVDNHLLAVVKPAGVPLVPDASGDESLFDRARDWVRTTYAKPGEAWLGVVHRLDRPVSGVVLFARTSKAARRLSAAFRAREVEKTYWGVGERMPPGEEGVLEHYLWKDREKNRVSVVERERAGAQLARTHWRVLARAGSGEGARVLLELLPVTGRGHQLRVAAAALGCPLLGDLKYGARAPLPDKSIALHARKLVVPHPTRPARMTFACDPPELAIWSFRGGAPGR